jgi:hypothetical protein
MHHADDGEGPEEVQPEEPFLVNRYPKHLYQKVGKGTKFNE